MSLSGLLSQALEITSTFNPRIAIILFLLCCIGEIGFALPYILETIWLIAGYQLARGTLPFPDLLLIWLVAQAGRQTGSLVLYYSGVLGLTPIKKFYHRHIEPKLPKRQIIPPGIVKSLANPSPFSIAMGRLVGLRIPMALTMSARQKLSHLALGVLLSSIIWDGVYLIIGGTLGPKVVPQPEYILLYSLGGLTVLYLVTLGVRYFMRRRAARKKLADNQRCSPN
jgi:membrane protein DedA with SNARE-associated domain